MHATKSSCLGKPEEINGSMQLFIFSSLKLSFINIETRRKIVDCVVNVGYEIPRNSLLLQLSNFFLK